MPISDDVLKILCSKISLIEHLMQENSKILSENLDIGFLIKNGINGYKQKILNEFKLSPQDRLYAKIRTDMKLRHPHRKILDFLIEKFDVTKNQFHEIYFSKIVKECRLGKNKAKEYLEYLVERGYLCRRDDGYRVWYVIDNRDLD